jgi:diguanylate cyclase (GGDEF)-like protein
MPKLAKLAGLTLLASRGREDGSVEAALTILRDSLDATNVYAVYGSADGFRHAGTQGELGLTSVALWLVQRELVTRGGLCAFDVTGGRVGGFRTCVAGEPCGYIACLLPTPGSSAEMLIVEGPWPLGLRPEAVKFAIAAQPALALVVTRHLRMIDADVEGGQLSALMNIAQVISRSQDMEQILTNIASGVADVARVEYVTIDVTDDDGDAILRCVNYSLPVGEESLDRWSHAVRRPDPIRQAVLRTREPALFADAQNDPRLPEPARAYFSRSLIRSTAMFPMIAQGEVIGALSVAANRPLDFDGAQCALLSGLATQAATAVSGIRLYERLAEKSAELELALRAERERARRDSLTGVWNHAAITELLDAELHRATPEFLAVIMVDVDGMKVVNDTFGHLSGDEVLKAVAHVLSREGAVVGRYGGDEFLVFLPGLHREQAQRYIDEVLRLTEEIRIVDAATSAHVRALVSAGMAMFPFEASTMRELIRIADSAMYAAKFARSSGSDRNLSERISTVIDDLVPLLTSPGSLHDKVKLVARRLSDNAAYDAVECRLLPSALDGVSAHCVLLDGRSSELAERWRREQEHASARRGIAIMLETHRPTIADDLLSNTAIPGAHRDLLREMGLRSSLSVPMLWRNEMIGHITVGNRKASAFGPAEAQFLVAVARQVTAIVRMASLVDGLRHATLRLETSQAETVFMLAAAAEAHDHATGMHLRNIRTVSEAIARELGYDVAAVRELGLAATLHDIGKISVPDSVLSSPTRFDSDDWEATKMGDVLKQHSAWGAEFLRGREGFELASQVARWHHERWDGSGYPDRLSGLQIPEPVSIVSVADAFDAMISDRPYRAGRPANEAVQELVKFRGVQFNPNAVDAVVRLFEREQLPVHASGEDDLAA